MGILPTKRQRNECSNQETSIIIIIVIKVAMQQVMVEITSYKMVNVWENFLQMVTIIILLE